MVGSLEWNVPEDSIDWNPAHLMYRVTSVLDREKTPYDFIGVITESLVLVGSHEFFDSGVKYAASVFYADPLNGFLIPCDKPMDWTEARTQDGSYNPRAYLSVFTKFGSAFPLTAFYHGFIAYAFRDPLPVTLTLNKFVWLTPEPDVQSNAMKAIHEAIVAVNGKATTNVDAIGYTVDGGFVIFQHNMPDSRAFSKFPTYYASYIPKAKINTMVSEEFVSESIEPSTYSAENTLSQIYKWNLKAQINGVSTGRKIVTYAFTKKLG